MKAKTKVKAQKVAEVQVGPSIMFLCLGVIAALFALFTYMLTH